MTSIDLSRSTSKLRLFTKQNIVKNAISAAQCTCVQCRPLILSINDHLHQNLTKAFITNVSKNFLELKRFQQKVYQDVPRFY